MIIPHRYHCSLYSSFTYNIIHIHMSYAFIYIFTFHWSHIIPIFLLIAHSHTQLIPRYIPIHWTHSYPIRTIQLYINTHATSFNISFFTSNPCLYHISFNRHLCIHTFTFTFISIIFHFNIYTFTFTHTINTHYVIYYAQHF